MPKKIISVVSGKGGVGKSSLAVNIATLCAKAGASTVLIDADVYNPCVFFHLGLSPQSAGLQELLNGSSKLEEVLPIHPASGLRCISSSIQAYGKTRYERLAKVIDQLNYEYIIIDCPPGFSPLIEESVAVSNNIFVMMTPDMPSCTAALKLVTFVKNHIGSKEVKFTYFLNRVSSAPYEIHPREVESLFRSRIGSVIPEDQNVPRSIAAKTPLVLMSPNSPFSKAMKTFSSVLLRDRDHRYDLQPQPPRYVSPTAEERQEQHSGGIAGWITNFLRGLFGR
jgi:MinD-like ATPase involved in chromosome partitioning or flagellar assembly